MKFVSREEMVPPFVTITVDADGDYAIGASRPTVDSYVVDVEKVPSGEIDNLRREIESTVVGNDARLFIYADAKSSTGSFVLVLAALAELHFCDLLVVVNENGN